MSDAPCGRDGHKINLWEGYDQIPQVVNDGGADIDRFFDALGDTRRRLVLLHLNDNGSTDLGQLAESVAEREGVDPCDETVEGIRIDLHHRHLPTLANHGLASYDTRTNVASLEPLPTAVEEILDLTRDLEGPTEE